MYKFFALIIFFFCTLSDSSAQKRINWLSWEEALERHQIERKKLLVDIYTDWCTICKQMERTTLSNPNIVDYINKNYYAIKFDAEDKSAIIFNNKVYKPIKSFGKRPTHGLAIDLTNGNLSYPTIVYIDENLKVIQPLTGYFNVKDFEMIMTFFAGNHYKEMHWKKYTKQFNSQYFNNKPVVPSDYQPPVQTAKSGGK